MSQLLNLLTVDNVTKAMQAAFKIYQTGHWIWQKVKDWKANKESNLVHGNLSRGQPAYKYSGRIGGRLGQTRVGSLSQNIPRRLIRNPA